MTLKYKVALVLGVFALGLAFGRFSLPAQVVEKEKIVYQDKIVEKLVESKQVVKKNNTVTDTITTKHPDGTVTTETKVVDKNTTDVLDKTKEEKTQDITKTDDKEKTTMYATQSTIISVAVDKNFGDTLSTPNYGLQVQRRLLGPIYLGVIGFTDKDFSNKTAGITLGLAF